MKSSIMLICQRAAFVRSFFQSVYATLPGLGIVALITLFSVAMTLIPALAMFSPVIFSVLIGILVGSFVRMPTWGGLGLSFASRTLLRLAVVLLGLQVPLNVLISIGWLPLAIVLVITLVTFIMVQLVAPLLGVDRRLAELLGAGTAICGASAIVAMNAVSSAEEEDVAYALAAITILGTVAMFALPLLSGHLGLEATTFALWAGSAIHEVGQVAGAAAIFGSESEELAMMTKLARVLLLAPLVMGAGLMAIGTHKGTNAGMRKARIPIVPAFVLGFFLCVVVASLVSIPANILDFFRTTSTLLLTAALGALSLNIDVRKLASRGIRPFLLAVGGTLFISGTSLAALLIFG